MTDEKKKGRIGKGLVAFSFMALPICYMVAGASQAQAEMHGSASASVGDWLLLAPLVFLIPGVVLWIKGK